MHDSVNARPVALGIIEAAKPAPVRAANCIKGHTKAALRQGATRQELMEAIWVAAEMRAGGAYAHTAISLTAMDEAERQSGG